MNLGLEVVTDNCGDPTVTNNAPAVFPLGTTTVIWTATDACGNTTSESQVIKVRDRTDPILGDLPENGRVDGNAIPEPANVTATDNCDTDVMITLEENKIILDENCPDSYNLKRTWTATDNCGNTASKSQVVKVRDRTDPILVGAPEETITVECDAIPEPPTVTATDNCDGTVTAFATGGSASYTYNWTSVPAGTYPTDSALTGLCAGTYIVTIADVNTCSITDSITVSEPSEITVTSIQTDAACSESCDGSSTVTPTGGTGSYTYQWNGNTTVGQTNTLTNLCYGINYVQIFDQNNCSIIDTINIGAIDTIIANAGLDTNYCLGTTVNLNGVSGGPFTNVEWFELPNMNSLGTTNNITTTPTSTGVFGYVFQVTGACVVTDTVFITIDALPIIDAGEDVEIFEDEEAILTATGGSTYSWSPGETLNDSTVSSPIASPSITTIAQHGFTMGKQAVEVLIDKIEKESEVYKPKKIVISSDLKVRESTKPSS